MVNFEVLHVTFDLNFFGKPYDMTEKKFLISLFNLLMFCQAVLGLSLLSLGLPSLPHSVGKHKVKYSLIQEINTEFHLFLYYE